MSIWSSSLLPRLGWTQCLLAKLNPQKRPQQVNGWFLDVTSGGQSQAHPSRVPARALVTSFGPSASALQKHYVLKGKWSKCDATNAIKPGTKKRRPKGQIDPISRMYEASLPLCFQENLTLTLSARSFRKGCFGCCYCHACQQHHDIVLCDQRTLHLNSENHL